MVVPLHYRSHVCLTIEIKWWPRVEPIRLVYYIRNQITIQDILYHVNPEYNKIKNII